MPNIVYILRKPPQGSTTRALLDHGTGGLNVGALRLEGGSWPPNVVLEHLPSCTEDGCEAGCPVRSLAEQAGRAAPGRFHVVGTPVPEKPPWMT